ncbi:DNA polymerase iota-like [Apostichopus japonicus]|uniref:DNA polymerase iota-like n=1 Tax=Stichopus japonicus TaxID=307972 RepID=UPI003AB247DE
MCRRKKTKMKRSWQEATQDDSDLGEEDIEDWSSVASSILVSPSSKNTPQQAAFSREHPPLESDHSRTIVHIDLDCFYAQVEMIRNPQLRAQPLGIQQKNIVVTCNYVAREFGVTKLMYIADAKKKCPNLVLVSGEDLSHYREYSEKVTDLLQSEFSSLVERLGFDENFVDVTSLVEKTVPGDQSLVEVKGHTFGPEGQVACICGCHKRMAIASHIASRMRARLREAIGITGCAGIAWNKLLAKLVGEKNKPNDQTTLLPGSEQKLMLSLGHARRIPGIGHSMNKKLESAGIVTIADLQRASYSDLEAVVGSQSATSMKNSSFGIDNTAVTRSGPPQSMSDEDSFKLCASLNDAKERMYNLLNSLLERLEKDGRTPLTIRLTIRKHSSAKKWLRESRQTQIPVSATEQIKKGIFTVHGPLMEVLLVLFKKMVDVEQSFHLTLINVCLTNFQAKSTFSKSLDKYFSKAKNIENERKSESEQGAADICKKTTDDSTNNPKVLTNQQDSNITQLFEKQGRRPLQTASKVLENKQNKLSFFTRKLPSDVKTTSKSDPHQGDGELSQGERDKTATLSRTRYSVEVKNDKPIDKPEGDISSETGPSFAKSDEVEKDFLVVTSSREQTSEEMSSSSHQSLEIPGNVDVTVFKSLPLDMQADLLREWKVQSTRDMAPEIKTSSALSSQPSTSNRRITDFFTRSKETR